MSSDVSNNTLVDLPGLGAAVMLERLNVSMNQLTVEVFPKEPWTKLRVVDVSNNALDSVPAAVWSSPELVFLVARQLVGNVILSSDAPKLEYLDLSSPKGTRVTGAWLANLVGRCPTLRTLTINDCAQPQDDVFSGFWGHNTLSYVELRGCTRGKFDSNWNLRFPRLMVVDVRGCPNLTWAGPRPPMGLQSVADDAAGLTCPSAWLTVGADALVGFTTMLPSPSVFGFVGCKCTNASHFWNMIDKCWPCPSHATCRPEVDAENWAVVDPGYFPFDSATGLPVRWLNQTERVSLVPCRSLHACNGRRSPKFSCDEGRVPDVPLCGLCDAHHYDSAGKCERCTPWIIVGGPLFGVVVFVAVLVWLGRRQWNHDRSATLQVHSTRASVLTVWCR